MLRIATILPVTGTADNTLYLDPSTLTYASSWTMFSNSNSFPDRTALSACTSSNTSGRANQARSSWRAEHSESRGHPPPVCFSKNRAAHTSFHRSSLEACRTNQAVYVCPSRLTLGGSPPSSFPGVEGTARVYGIVDADAPFQSPCVCAGGACGTTDVCL